MHGDDLALARRARMRGILPARKYSCRPWEPILWATHDQVHNGRYAVEGMHADGEIRSFCTFQFADGSVLEIRHPG
jgi:hypothetical protein